MCVETTLANGVVSPSGNVTEGTPVTLACNENYQLSGGDSMRTCQSDGNFNGTLPTCLRG